MTGPLLEARDVDFAYPGGYPVLEGWSETFVGGSMTAITATSGRGKSTLLHILGLMLRPAHGEVLIQGMPTRDVDDRGRARLRAGRFGFVFQDAALDATRSVIDNVIEPALYRRSDRHAVRRTALALLEQFDVGVPPQARPGRVSGGQLQRIALCRALLLQPAILRADEPTGSLDPSTGALVVDALRAHAETGAAVIVVTHSPAVAAACDREIAL